MTDVNLLIARESATLAQINYEEAVEKFEALRYAPLDSEARKKALGDVGGYRSVRDNKLAEYNWYLGEIDQLELQTREAAVELAKAELEEAQYQYQKALKGPTDAEKMQAQSKIDSYQKKIDSSKIIAPFSGTVTQINAKAGDVIFYDSGVAARNIFALRIDDISTFYMDFTVSELYINSIKEFAKSGKPQAAICAAPLALAAHGALEGKNATIYPGMEDHLAGAKPTGETVTIDGGVITGMGPALAMEFALALVGFLKGEKTKKEVATGLL